MKTAPKIQGFRCKRLRSFKPIFKEWIRATTELTELMEEDGNVPWWYTERASLSVFAGALWRCGGLCFEEYSETKRKIGKRTGRFKGQYTGRVDLYFLWAGFHFVAEAKDTWSGSSKAKADPKARIAGCLRRARKDVRVSEPNGQRRLGIVFAMPYFVRKAKSQLNDKIESWVESLGDLDTSAYAWVFPKRARYFHNEDEYCPGVAVLIKEVKK